MWASCWGCSYSLLCTRVMRNMICDCIYPHKFCTPTGAHLESETAGAKDLTSKLSVFGRIGCWFWWALVCPCGTNAHELWACISSAPEAHFLLWLSSKSSLYVRRNLCNMDRSRTGWVSSGLLTHLVPAERLIKIYQCMCIYIDTHHDTKIHPCICMIHHCLLGWTGWALPKIW